MGSDSISDQRKRAFTLDTFLASHLRGMIRYEVHPIFPIADVPKHLGFTDKV
jgi:hypothetical protein